MKTLSIAAVVALTAMAFVAPTAAADDFTCYADQYIVVPLGAGYVDFRALFGVYDPADKFLFSIWLYVEAGGDAGNLDRGDDFDATGAPSDAGYCGLGLLPPVVDDMQF